MSYEPLEENSPTSVIDPPAGEVAVASYQAAPASDCDVLTLEKLSEVKVKKSWKDRFPNGIDWGVAAWMAGMHVGAVAALWFFSWPGLIAFLVLHWVSASLGICLGYHRLLTHGSLVVPRWLEYTLSLCGMLSAEGSPVVWVANHRKHHAHSDQEEDPHSPNEGFWWSHFVWFHPHRLFVVLLADIKRWAPDMWKDPGQRFLHYAFPYFSLATGVVLFLVGHYAFNNGLSFVLWGLCARSVACYHSTWFVNSATHMWGYRNYDTTDRSRNLWWVAVLSYGEGWHNNHHAHQRMARHGHRWWEVDMTYMVIQTLRAFGLAKNVQDKIPVGRKSDAA